MEVKKELHPKEPPAATQHPRGEAAPDVEDDDDWKADRVNIYLADDLTKMRANLAYQTRQAKRDKKLMDTWVIDTKIMIKDKYSRISQVTSVEHLMSKVN